MSDVTRESVLTAMQQRRQSLHITRADIDRVIEARHTGRWHLVYRSRLYRLYGAEYCELLEVIARAR